MHVLVTGGRGFIGSTFVRSWLTNRQPTMKELDNNGDQTITKITAYCRNTNDWTRPRLEQFPLTSQAQAKGDLRIVYGDLGGDVSGLCEGIDAVIHFAAKTYVDHSIRDPAPFVQANVLGTATLLEDARRQGVKAFINVSTDEVYGQILEGAYDESAPLCPRNPYAASKAGADALAISYYYTFKMWTAVTRTENNYGIYQHPQKALPVFIGHALRDEYLPVYGDGEHIRQWLYVQDHVNAIMVLLEKYKELPGGEVWHIAGNQEFTNNELARTILRLTGKPETNIRYLDDMNIRPGHDRRYALQCKKMHALGWKPEVSLEDGLRACVNWYGTNPSWLG